MCALILVVMMLLTPCVCAETGPVSATAAQVLRQPLPPEDLSCVENNDEIVVKGPVFCYKINPANGSVIGVEAMRGDEKVVSLCEPAGLRLDDVSLAEVSGGATQVLENGSARVVLETKCLWAPNLPCTVHTTVYNDGVLVSTVTLSPETDVMVKRGLFHEVKGAGCFTHYLHKRRDTNGLDCYQGVLPKAGESAVLNTPTSCLEAFSDTAALALFTDMGACYRSPADSDTAEVQVEAVEGHTCVVRMRQYLIRTGAGGTPYTLRAGDTFTFRTGLAVAPNRHPHPRRRDLRMFIWVGDERYPYPTDEEIRAAARLGYTLFQMHRLGPPGEPRSPEEEFDRVLKTVHDAGMLFIWTANADLQYRHDPVVARMVAEGQWARWQGFNYGGRYTASMDGFCDTLATCLASPNGLADYRIQGIERMLERYPIDGMYIDDNLAYANCTLWKEHGHPQPVYDCLIELHEVNWRRRQALRAGCPHAVLIDHSSQGFVLPVISSFDSHLFGEGYSFPSVEMFRDTFGSYENMYAQGCLWAGDSETTRCGVEVAYIFDLLTGGGKYSYLDWRLWPEKFPYASGVKQHEPLFVKTYNLIQYNFGLYETEFLGRLDTTMEGTYAALYHNRVWKDNLVVLANMNTNESVFSLKEPGAPLQLLDEEGTILSFDVHQRQVSISESGPFVDVRLQPYQMKVVYLRNVSKTPIVHVWGGKRIQENWDAVRGKFSLQLDGPAGLEDTIILYTNSEKIGEIRVDNEPMQFYSDPERGLIHGKITYGKSPCLLEVCPAEKESEGLPVRALTPDEIGRYYNAE